MWPAVKYLKRKGPYEQVAKAKWDSRVCDCGIMGRVFRYLRRKGDHTQASNVDTRVVDYGKIGPAYRFLRYNVAHGEVPKVDWDSRVGD
jgi:hypothetical protein